MRPEDEDGGYSLVVLATRATDRDKYDCPALCLCSLPDISSQKDDMDHQWVVKDRDCVNGADRFVPDVAFSCNGNAVWGDLVQGIMYCNCWNTLVF